MAEASLSPEGLADALLGVHRAADPDQACRAALLALTPIYGPAYLLRLVADRPGGPGRAVSFLGSDGPVFARLRAAGCPAPQRIDLPALVPPTAFRPEPHHLPLAESSGSEAVGEWPRVAARELGVSSGTAIALGGDGREAGALVLLTASGWPQQIAGVTVAHVGAAVANLLRAQEVQRSAEIDPETLVYTARRLEGEAVRELQRAARYRHNLSLIVVRTGEQPAHPARPRELASALVRTIRRSDVVGRLDSGGFALILPETGTAGAARVIARLGERASRARLAVEAGSATFPADGRSWGELRASADGRLRAIDGPLTPESVTRARDGAPAAEGV